jgi:hypothetical protein
MRTELAAADDGDGGALRWGRVLFGLGFWLDGGWRGRLG